MAGQITHGIADTRHLSESEVQALIDGYVQELNGKLNRWETVKKFAILPRDLSIEAGEITPSMKIRRRNVEENFAAEIDKMYSGTLAQM